MKKKYCLAANIVLLVWFFLNMIGVYFGEKYLVTRSWKEDGIFFLIFLAALLLFAMKERIGKYILSIWLSMWLITQFFSHEWLTITGTGEGKSQYFEHALKWVNNSSGYVTDVYHTILHIFIAIALILTITYCIRGKKSDSI